MAIHSREFIAFGFRTTHEALAAERALVEAGIGVVPIPSPKSFGGLCGIAMRVEPAQESAALAALAHARIEPKVRETIEDRVVAP